MFPYLGFLRRGIGCAENARVYGDIEERGQREILAPGREGVVGRSADGREGGIR